MSDPFVSTLIVLIGLSMMAMAVYDLRDRY